MWLSDKQERNNLLEEISNLKKEIKYLKNIKRMKRIKLYGRFIRKELSLKKLASAASFVKTI